MKLIIDSDPIVYMAGFAGESHQWRLYWIEICPNGEEVEHELFFDSKTDLNDYLADEGLEAYEDTLFDIERIVTPEPVSHVLYTVKRMIEGMIADVAQNAGISIDDVKTQTVLSGPGNFRLQLAKTKPYKGNRDPEWRPYHYQNIRDYLTERWNAKVIEGMEADDYLSIMGHASPYTVIATIDKDLDQIPGWHYNYKNKEYYHVNKEAADDMVWYQTLNGDTTDNIPGIYRLGPATAERLVSAWRDGGCNDAYRWQQTVELYAQSMRKYPAKYPPNSTPEEIALEQTRLVRLLKTAGMLWSPDGDVSIAATISNEDDQWN